MTGPEVLAVLLLATFVAVVAARPRRRLVGRSEPGGVEAGRTSPPLSHRLRALAGRALLGRHRSRDRPLDLGLICTRAASRLRAGAGPDEAWAGAFGARSSGSGGPGSLDGDRGSGSPGGVAVAGAVTTSGRGEVPAALAALAGTSGAADAALVACRLAARCGTPLAEILDECASGISEAQAAEAERRRALAGPITTARMLLWLPAASLVLGAGLGGDPFSAVLDGGPGALSVTVGLGLLLAGRAWIRALVRTAERE